MAELLEITESTWFPMFSIGRHVSEVAEYDSCFPVRIIIDTGTSRYTGAVLFQMRPRQTSWPTFTVFADYHALDVLSADNAAAIRRLCTNSQARGPDLVWLDPVANATTSIGLAAFNKYARVFEERLTER